MSNTIVQPVVCKPVVKGQQCFQMLEPLAGVTEQDATPFVGPWVPQSSFHFGGQSGKSSRLSFRRKLGVSAFLTG
jgi:hypothetical protein